MNCMECSNIHIFRCSGCNKNLYYNHMEISKHKCLNCYWCGYKSITFHGGRNACNKYICNKCDEHICI